MRTTEMHTTELTTELPANVSTPATDGKTPATFVPAVAGSQRYRMFGAPGTVWIATLAMIVLVVLFTGAAHAAAPGGSFQQLGGNLGQIVCDFVKSPVILVIVVVSLIATLIALTLNEDNKFLTSVLKAMIAGLAIWSIGSIVTVLNIGDIGCS